MNIVFIFGKFLNSHVESDIKNNRDLFEFKFNLIQLCCVRSNVKPLKSRQHGIVVLNEVSHTEFYLTAYFVV